MRVKISCLSNYFIVHEYSVGNPLVLNKSVKSDFDISMGVWIVEREVYCRFLVTNASKRSIAEIIFVCEFA
jgi:hypothetical protein